MEPTPIRAFLFDIGNVLLRFDFSIALRSVAEQSDVPDALGVLGAVESIKEAYEDGRIDRRAFLQGAFEVLRYRGRENDFVAAWEDIFEPNAPMVALVERLAGNYPLYLLSNTSDIHREFVFRTYPFLRHFTSGIYSYEVRASKPERRIYEIARDQLGLEPESTFFVDDLLPNIETARSLGFACHHYHFERHGALLADLQERRIQF
jgi:glucose-1-phosphatase